MPRAFAPTHVSFALTGSTFYEMTSEVVDGQPVELFGRHGPMFYITFGHWRFAVLEGLFRIGLAIFDMVLLARFFVSFRRVDVGQRCAEQPWIMALLALAIFGINDVFFFSRIDTMGKWFQPPISVQRTFFSALYLFLALCLSSIVRLGVVQLDRLQARRRARRHAGARPGPPPSPLHRPPPHRLYRPRPRPHLAETPRSQRLSVPAASSSAPTPSPPPRCSSTCSASSRWAAGSSTSSLAAFRVRARLGCPRTLDQPADILLAGNLILLPVALTAFSIAYVQLMQKWLQIGDIMEIAMHDPENRQGFMSDLRQKFTLPYLLLINQYLYMLARAHWPSTLIKFHPARDGTLAAATPSILLSPLDKV